MKNNLLLLILLFSVQLSFSQTPEFRHSSRFVLGMGEERSASIGVGDIDNDGDIDAVVANGRHWPQANQVFINNGYGIFTVSKLLDDICETTYAAELADLDGDIDILITNRGKENEICLNNGQLNFSEKISFGSGNDETRAIAVADINQDGYKDIGTANIGEVNVVYFGNKELNYSRKKVFDSSSSRSYSVAVGDLDDNGSPDIVITNVGEPNKIFLNIQTGNSWDEIQLGSPDLNTYDIILADLNKDKRLDIIESNSDAANYYYFNIRNN